MGELDDLQGSLTTEVRARIDDLLFDYYDILMGFNKNQTTAEFKSRLRQLNIKEAFGESAETCLKQGMIDIEIVCDCIPTPGFSF
jgi:hypothetical protein